MAEGCLIQDLQRMVKTLLDGPEVEGFISQLHPDDLDSLRQAIGNLPNSMHNDLITSLRHRFDKNRELAVSDSRHTQKELRDLFFEFAKQFDRRIDEQLGYQYIFDLAEPDIEAADKKYYALWNILRYSQRREDQLVQSIIQRAQARVHKEAQERSQRLEGAENQTPRQEDKKVSEIQAWPEDAREKEEAQEWLDQRREEAYENVRDQFRRTAPITGDRYQENIREWFANFWNQGFTEAGIEQLKPEDLDSLMYAELMSDSASQVAGKKIVRPVFIFFHTGQYQGFSRRFQGEKGMVSRGMVFPGEVFPEDHPFRKTGLIISTPITNFIAHEIRHTIDPNVNDRKGYDSILTEAFGYYQEEVIEKYEKEGERTWGLFSATLMDSLYFEPYSRGSAYQLSWEQYKELCSQVGNALQSIQKQHGHLETQRMLVQMKTLHELFATAQREPLPFLPNTEGSDKTESGP